MEAQQAISVESSKLVAAAYYPDWSADSWPPESLDYSKFDILFYGEHVPLLLVVTAAADEYVSHDAMHVKSVCDAEFVVWDSLG